MNNIISVQDFFRNPNTRNFVLSPDGNHIAFLKNINNRMTLHVSAYNGEYEKILVQPGDRDLVEIFWGNNDIVLYIIDTGGDENNHTYSVSISTGEVRNLTPFQGAFAVASQRLYNDDNCFFLASNKRMASVMDMYKLNITTGEIDMLYENNESFVGFQTDYNDIIRLAFASDGAHTYTYHRKTSDEKFSLLFAPNANEKFTVYNFAEDNRHIYVGAHNGRDKAGIYLFDTETSEFIKEILYDSEFDVALDMPHFGRMLFSRKQRVPICIQYQRDYPTSIAIDDYYKTIFDNVKKYIGSSNINLNLNSVNENETIFTFIASTDKQPKVEYLYNSLTNELRLLKEKSAHLPQEQMCEMKPIKYKSRDGFDIHSYLTLPILTEPKNLPAIILPHGGPNFVRDVWDWNPLVQFLANRGYAVLQPNYRGSDGYGKKFFEICFKQWGRTMQDDITDGVLWLIEQGIADKESIGIMGGSYGGYAALAGVTFTPDLYHCGVSIVGISNLFTFIESIPAYWEPLLKAMYERIGHPELDKEILYNASPLFFADKIRVPMLIAQGANDPRVKQSEADQIVAKLRSSGKEVEYILKENEGHGFQNEENKFELFEVVERFFAKHLGGKSFTNATMLQ